MSSSNTGVGGRWLEFPIRDRSVPRDPTALLALLDRLTGLLHRPTTMVTIRWAAGVGRTGAAAASLLVRMGLSHDGALTVVEHAGSEPETARQLAFVRKILPASG
ncbi:MAG: hypothetical protein EOP84_01315 [Verrucomicrobiaceae bacterium]|nr:MAG: hypothetical protein EOP84_01315 [Verrucomicrobiaceae bacterium]